MKILNLLFLLTITLLLFACGKNYTPEELRYIEKIEQEREETNKWYKTNPNSPFHRKGKVPFHDLNYFDVDPSFVYKSKLYEYENKDSIIVYGTKGEARPTIRWGYIMIKRNERDYKIHVYEGKTSAGKIYYSIWFTDKTTNETTYGVGRYLNFDKEDDPDHIYTIDFNLAYNPYCAYSPNFTCAIPTKEDYIDLAIEAGEKTFHD